MVVSSSDIVVAKSWKPVAGGTEKVVKCDFRLLFIRFRLRNRGRVHHSF